MKNTIDVGDIVYIKETGRRYETFTPVVFIAKIGKRTLVAKDRHSGEPTSLYFLRENEEELIPNVDEKSITKMLDERIKQDEQKLLDLKAKESSFVKSEGVLLAEAEIRNMYKNLAAEYDSLKIENKLKAIQQREKSIRRNIPSDIIHTKKEIEKINMDIKGHKVQRQYELDESKPKDSLVKISEYYKSNKFVFCESLYS